jgi:hypothetical protein
VAHDHLRLQQVSRQGDSRPERETYYYSQLIQELKMCDLYLHRPSMSCSLYCNEFNEIISNRLVASNGWVAASRMLPEAIVA